MRVLFGMILGVALTFGVAFFHDSAAVSTRSEAGVHRNMVNWDVVSDNWRSVRERVHAAWNNLSSKMAG